MTPDDLLRLALTMTVLYLWTDNMLRSYGLWSDHKDARSFRAFLIGFMIELGALAFVFSAIGTLLPYLRPLSAFFGLMVTGALLVVGIFTWWSWRHR